MPLATNVRNRYVAVCWHRMAVCVARLAGNLVEESKMRWQALAAMMSLKFHFDPRVVEL